MQNHPFCGPVLLAKNTEKLTVQLLLSKAFLQFLFPLPHGFYMEHGNLYILQVLSRVLLQIHFMVGIPEVNPPKIMKKWEKNKTKKTCVENVNKTWTLSMLTLQM